MTSKRNRSPEDDLDYNFCPSGSKKGRILDLEHAPQLEIPYASTQYDPALSSSAWAHAPSTHPPLELEVDNNPMIRIAQRTDSNTSSPCRQDYQSTHPIAPSSQPLPRSGGMPWTYPPYPSFELAHSQQANTDFQDSGLSDHWDPNQPSLWADNLTNVHPQAQVSVASSSQLPAEASASSVGQFLQGSALPYGQGLFAHSTYHRSLWDLPTGSQTHVHSYDTASPHRWVSHYPSPSNGQLQYPPPPTPHTFVSVPAFSESRDGRTGPHTVQIQTPLEVVATGTNEASQSFFSNATGFNVENFKYVQRNGTIQMRDGWTILMENTAPNALHNSDARYDPPKCDEDTRVEVTNEIMGWIQDHDSPTQLLCMTGAAGSGKSALQQTVANRCAGLNILASSFFFSVGDPTRNHALAVVPTIAYQLGQASPALRRSIQLAVETDPLIFNKSLRTQMDALLVNPVVTLLSSGPQGYLPFAVLIDGLDECNDEARQKELLKAIQESLIGRTPFRIFLASRPELAIFGALQPGGHLHTAAYHIRLSDDYDATADIRHTLQRRLRELGERRLNNGAWFSDADVEAIVEASSGQYIHAATAIRYVSDPRGSPIARLKAVLTWTPGKNQKAKPFASLDLLYTNILTKAKQEYDAVDTNQHDFILAIRSYVHIRNLHPTTSMDMRERDWLLGLEDVTHEQILCDLRSLVNVTVVRGEGRFVPVSMANSEESVDIWGKSTALSENKRFTMTLYHKSLQDFLESEDRAGPFYVSLADLRKHLLQCCMRSFLLVRSPDVGELLDRVCGIAVVFMHNLLHDHAYRLEEPEESIIDIFIRFTRDGGWEPFHTSLRNRKEYILLVDWIHAARLWLLPPMKRQAPDTAVLLQGYHDRWIKRRDRFSDGDNTSHQAVIIDVLKPVTKAMIQTPPKASGNSITTPA